MQEFQQTVRVWIRDNGSCSMDCALIASDCSCFAQLSEFIENGDGTAGYYPGQHCVAYHASQAIRNTPKIKPCPFCGRRAGVDYIRDMNPPGPHWFSFCYSCGAHGPRIYCNNADDNKRVSAIEAWNNRR
jgi:Lar family restriction alleviation protein